MKYRKEIYEKALASLSMLRASLPEDEIPAHYDNLCAAADHYGLAAQTEKAVEELRELIEALQLPRDTAGICEEIADVYNMLDQLCYLMDAEDSVQEIAERKMERQIARIAAQTKSPDLTKRKIPDIL